MSYRWPIPSPICLPRVDLGGPLINNTGLDTESGQPESQHQPSRACPNDEDIDLAFWELSHLVHYQEFRDSEQQ